MVWGTCHIIFFARMMSRLDFWTHAGRFFLVWAAPKNSTSKFFSLPALQNSETCERGQLIQGMQNTAR